jgi:hypothetical protein
MLTKYIGVFCHDCGRFIEITRYPAKYPEYIRFDFGLDAGTEIHCTNAECGHLLAYSNRDVAHSSSPDGSHPVFPFRRAREF